MTAPPLVRIAELEIDPAQVDRYRALLTAEIEASVRLKPGVLTLSAVSPKGRPEQVRLIETDPIRVGAKFDDARLHC